MVLYTQHSSQNAGTQLHSYVLKTRINIKMDIIRLLEIKCKIRINNNIYLSTLDLKKQQIQFQTQVLCACL